MVPAEIVRYVLSLHAMSIVELKVLSQPLADSIPQVGDPACKYLFFLFFSYSIYGSFPFSYRMGSFEIMGYAILTL